MGSKRARPSGFASIIRQLGRVIGVLVGLAMLAVIPGLARAGCSFNGGNTQGTYLVSVPTTLVNDPSIPVGSVLYTSSATAVSQAVNFTCKNSGNGWGLLGSSGATLPSGVNLFPTGTTGVGYRVSQKGDYIYAYPYFSLDSGASWVENDAVTIELVKTGTITDGSALQGALSQFKAGTSSNYIIDAVINLANRLTFTAPACQVSTSNINVTLPTVTGQAFSGVGSVTGTTPFQIGLICSKGAIVRVTLDTATPVAGKPGVIAPSSGGSSGVGVQVLDSSGTTPVSFGVAKTIGATPNGALSVSYFARYYQTGATVGTGLLGATATFTLSYQ
ncbi:fimbrial protein [Rhodanobacter sp. AS-Z3]|uniref:fimbrial protein n=1 Tax=Rhodanobacter sp. AS-Z3 TaxID=3031330 RepID=UPI002478FF8D|nr:fimbrial protein [Rhodanobacter sp. AS-Z3]WEN15218.1 fimbrial protein [Rhodanobacter sp. AS-Z3]